jgi:hypothetical protein
VRFGASRLPRSARSAMLPPCVISARILRCTCETAFGPRAGADIAVPGGRSAEGKAVMAITPKCFLDRVYDAEGLSTDEEQAEFTTLLLDVNEIFGKLEQRMHTLIADASSELPASVSWEDIGKQFIFVRWVQGMADALKLDALRMEKATYFSLDELREHGYAQSVPLFSRYGDRPDLDAEADNA